MIEIRVGIVDENTMRIGFQPPLSKEHKKLINPILPKHPSSPHSTMYQSDSEEGISCTAVDINADCNNSEWLEGIALSLAQRSAGILCQLAGVDVKYDPTKEICAIGWGEVLFPNTRLDANV